jgi:hypothetical protein
LCYGEDASNAADGNVRCAGQGLQSGDRALPKQAGIVNQPQL